MQKLLFKRRLRLAFFAVYIIGFTWWLSTTGLGNTGESLIYVGVAILVGGFIGQIAFGFRVKQILTRSFAPGNVRAGNVAEFPLLGLDELERLTLAWRDLGFEVRGDYAGNMENPRAGQTFSRVFEHPSQGAIAEVSQMFTPTQIVPFSASVLSFWGEREALLQSAAQLRALTAPAPLAAPTRTSDAAPPAPAMEIWALATHNRAPNKFWPLMRQARVVSRRLPRDATPKTLWQSHLETRADVEARLHQAPVCGDLEPWLDAYNRVVSARICEQLSRTPAWKFALARFSRAQAPTIYDGELPSAVPGE